MTAKGKSISLVLGGGGARGLAHIGVIEWLTENGYVIRSIAGSSMGALIGGIHATGKLHVYTQWVSALERMDVLRLLDPSLGGAGLLKGERVMAVLRDLIGDCAIEDLPVSFTAVATDVATGREVWMRTGKLFDTIRASIATPLVFTPVERGGRQLVDGCLVNPLPIAPTLDDVTDLTVAVSLSGRAEAALDIDTASVAARPPSGGNSYRARIAAFVDSLLARNGGDTASIGFTAVAFSSMEIMQNTIARLKLASYSPEVLIEIPRNACAYHEFWRAPELIALGRERAAAAFRKQLA